MTIKAARGTAAAPTDKPRTLEQMSQGREGVFKFDISQIQVVEGYNPRRIFEGIEELADDIFENGLRQPLIIRKLPNSETIALVDGERRFRALKHLVSTGRDPGPVRCIAENRNSTDLDRMFAPLSCNTGRELTLLEKAYHYKAIIDRHGITAAEIARRSQTTKQAVGNALLLVREASTAILSAVEDGTISATAALDIIRASDGHASQNEHLAAALATAERSGKTHITPAHIQTTTPPAPADSSPSDTTYIFSTNGDDDDEGGDQNDDDDQAEKDEEVDQSPAEPATTSSAPDPGAMDRIKKAPSTSRDGSSGPGSGGYVAPDKAIRSIEKILDDLDKHDAGLPYRIVTVEFVLGVINNERPAKELKNHLLGK